MTSATWERTCVSLVDYNIVDMLHDPHTSFYGTELIMQTVNISSLKDCALTCDVYSNWAVANRSNFGRQRKWKSTHIHIRILLLLLLKNNFAVITSR